MMYYHGFFTCVDHHCEVEPHSPSVIMEQCKGNVSIAGAIFNAIGDFERSLRLPQQYYIKVNKGFYKDGTTSESQLRGDRGADDP